MKKTHIIAKNDDERMTVVLPVPKHSVWPTENIAYFCSTGKSGVKEFNGTYFPLLGVYKEDITPLPDKDRSITLVENYFVKVSSITFLKPTADKMQEWIFTLLRNYYESRGMLKEFQYTLNDIRDIMDVKVLKQLDAMYKEIDLIYRCLSSYFTTVWQVHFSVCLSDTFKSGVWLSQLKGFADYIKSMSPQRTPKKTRASRSKHSFKITDDASLTSDDVYVFLIRNDAQCDFTTLRETMPIEWYATRSSHIHDSLFKNAQSIEMSLRLAERLKHKGGSQKTRKKSLNVS